MAPDIFTGQNLDQPRLKDNKGRWLCRSAIHRRDGWGFTQCAKLGKHQDADGIWWCETHEPERAAQRAAATDARQRAAWEKQHKTWRYGHQGERLRDALRQIANGHNDPRSLALEVLGDMLTNDLP